MVFPVAFLSMLPFPPWFVILLLIGGLGFLLYRYADRRQISYTQTVEDPKDLEHLTPAILKDKRQRKLDRSQKAFWKNSFHWSFQAGYILGGIPLLYHTMSSNGFKPGTIYTTLTVISFLLNVALSRFFSLWTPALPFQPHGTKPHRNWGFSNMAWQAWGVASWAVPVWFFFQAAQQQGWIGSVAMIWVSQVVQLVFFIFVIKRQAIPYQKYDGLSPAFKTNLQTYLKAQGFRDDEVGVLAGMKMGPNAFATGIFGYRQIVMTDELLKGYKDPQNPNFSLKIKEDTLEAIIAHEAGHIKRNHILKSIFLGGLLSSISTILIYYLFGGKGDFVIFDETPPRQIIMYWGQSFFNLMILFVSNYIMIGLIRSNEREADEWLMQTNGCKNGHDFFHQMRHLAPIPNDALWDRLNSTHPAPHEREAVLKKWQDEHCKGKPKNEA